MDGLSEAEAAERLVKVDLEALHEQENKDFKRRALRQNLLTTFNIDLFIIAIIMLGWEHQFDILQDIRDI